MTYKEIIDRLEFAKLRIKNCTYSPETIEAIEIAISIIREKQEKTLTNAQDFVIL